MADKPTIRAEEFDFGDGNMGVITPRPVRPPHPPGKYLVIHEGETPQEMVAEEFDNLDTAVAFARKRWGQGEYLRLEMPDETDYDFGGDMRERINLVRIRKGPLDPRQHLELEKWEKHPRLKGWKISLQKSAARPIDIYASVKDDEGRLLLIESLSSGLLEIIDWTDGGPFPDNEAIDYYLEAGRAKSI